MISGHELLAFIAAGLLLNLTPGPDVLYIVGRSASQGRLAGVVSALGIGAGCLVHIGAAVAGLSTLMARLPAVYEAVRWLGAGYLVFLGVRTLYGSVSRARPEAPASPVLTRFTEPCDLGRVFRQGIVTNVLNPKVALFFAAFLPQFVDPTPGAWPVPVQFLALGLIFNVNAAFVNTGYALAASQLGGWLRSRFGLSRWLDRITGGLFIALGVRLAMSKRP